MELLNNLSNILKPKIYFLMVKLEMYFCQFLIFNFVVICKLKINDLKKNTVMFLCDSNLTKFEQTISSFCNFKNKHYKNYMNSKLSCFSRIFWVQIPCKDIMVCAYLWLLWYLMFWNKHVFTYSSIFFSIKAVCILYTINSFVITFAKMFLLKRSGEEDKCTLKEKNA